MDRRRTRSKLQVEELTKSVGNAAHSGPKITHLSDHSVSKQTKKVKDMNKKALAYIYSVK